MNTDKWKLLIAAIDTGSLSAAGEREGYTVSGVSRMIAQLERETGFSLLYRGKNGVKPTNECQLLLPSVRELLFAQQKISETISAISGVECGNVSIGTASSRFYRQLTAIAAAFREDHPGIQFDFTYGTSSELTAKIAEHRLDFAVMSYREGDFDWHKLCDDPQIAIVPENHALAKLKAVPVKAFETVPFIETYPNQETDHSRTFAKYGVHPNTCYTTTDITASYAMVASGLGITINNRINSDLDYPDVKHLTLDPPQNIPNGIACSRNPAPAARLFSTFLLEHFIISSVNHA